MSQAPDFFQVLTTTTFRFNYIRPIIDRTNGPTFIMKIIGADTITFTLENKAVYLPWALNHFYEIRPAMRLALTHPCNLIYIDESGGAGSITLGTPEPANSWHNRINALMAAFVGESRSFEEIRERTHIVLELRTKIQNLYEGLEVITSDAIMAHESGSPTMSRDSDGFVAGFLRARDLMLAEYLESVNLKPDETKDRRTRILRLAPKQ